MQRFIDREGDLALRLLTTKESDFETRMIRLITRIVQHETDKGRLNASIPLDDLPYVLPVAGDDNLIIGTDYGHSDSSSEIEALQQPAAAADDSISTINN